MDIVVKKEPPDDDYCHAASVPEDSQWQKKRSKLHNLLFGSHGSVSPRVGTPEPVEEQDEPQGTSHVNEEYEIRESMGAHAADVAMVTTTEDDTTMEQIPIVKVENVEADEHDRHFIQSDSDNTVHHSNFESSSHHNGYDKYTTTSEQESRSSLLKSMLTCPMSNIKSPSFEEYQLVFNDNMPGKQRDSSEIRKMLSEPPKSGSPLNSPLFQSLTGSLNSGPLLQNALFASSTRPRSSSSASSLLKQLGSLSHSSLDRNPPSYLGLEMLGQTSHEAPQLGSLPHSSLERNPPSYLGLEMLGQTSHEAAFKNTYFGSLEKETPKSFAKKDKPNVKSKRSNKITENSSASHLQVVEDADSPFPEEEDTQIKAKAIEDAVGNFSQFLHNTMSKHDFSADQMNFIMESAIKSASKVITETAKRTNVSENMRATATNFIENAIGNAIRTETLRKETKNFDKFLTDSDQEMERGVFSQASKSLKSGKTRKKIKRPNVVEDKDQSISKKRKKQKRIAQTNETVSQEMVENGQELPFFEDQLSINRLDSDKKTLPYFEDQLSKRAKYDSTNLPYFEDQPAKKKSQKSVDIENQSQEIIAIKLEPEDNGYEQESCSELKKLKTDKLADAIKTEVDESNQTNTSHEVFVENSNKSYFTDTDNALECDEDHAISAEGIDHSDDNHESEDQSMDLAADAKSQEESKGDVDNVTIDHTIVKMEPDFVTDKHTLTAESNHLDTYTSDLQRNTRDGPIMGFLHEEMEKSLKEPVGDISCQLNNTGYPNFDAACKFVIPYAYKCDTCGQHFKHKGTLKVHQRGHNFKNGTDAKSKEKSKDDLETVMVDHTIVKMEPEFVTDEHVMTAESKDLDYYKSGLQKKIADDPVTDFIREEIEKSLKDPVRDISYQLNNTGYTTFDEASKVIPPPVFKCDTCGQEFEHKGTLKVHQRGHNFKNKTFQCSICGKCVTDTSYLKIHMKTHQPEIKAPELFECDVCNLQFSNFNNHQLHRRMHSGEKLFKCDVCGTGFTRKSQLSVHAKIHTGQKPYTCDICGMTFRQNGGLKLHLLVHTDDKPQKCPFCPASFSRKAHLDKHIRYHSGARPFVCTICEKAFIDRELLKQHMKTVHPDGKPGKRGIYKRRSMPDQIPDKLGPNWKGFVAVKEESEEETVVSSPCFPCGVCGETYSQISLLVEHLETHNDIKPYDPTSNTSVTNSSTGNSSTDNVVTRGILNCQTETQGQEGGWLHRSPGLGLDSLNIEKMFKCPFCEEMFDLPGPRIKHIHESHPFKNSTTGLDESIDNDYLMNRHLIDQRSLVDLYDSKVESRNGIDKPPMKTDTQSIKIPSYLSTNTPSSIPDNNISYKVVKTEPKSHIVMAENQQTVVTEEGLQKVMTGIRPEDIKQLWCPYCDRVYARQSSRTRHINESHREMKETYKFMKEMKERQQH